ncbi:hypothetical protein ACS0TY_015542 [Phlomoides rotata]
MEESSVHRDRLSELPLSLIHHILSFLPMTDVVSTTILSKHWENLWTTVPCLHFCYETDDEDYGTDDEDDRTRIETERLHKFVNRALILWKGAKILKFKIDIQSSLSLVSDVDINVWMRFAVNNKVEELELEIDVCGEHWAPQCLNTCSSLRKLALSGFNLQILGSPSWNQLKSLRIDMINGGCLSGDLINRILLGSPELEVFELKLRDNCENLNIRSRSLKRLRIKNIYLDSIEDNPPLDTLRICCPNLETLEIVGLFGEYLFTDFPFLIDATLHFHIVGHVSACLIEFLGETLKQVLSTIPHVEKVAVSELFVQVLGASRKKYLLSPLPNVKFLKLDVCCFELSGTMDLFVIFPNIKMLVINKSLQVLKPLDINAVNYLAFESHIFNSFLLELKTVEISSSYFDCSIFGLKSFC